MIFQCVFPRTRGMSQSGPPSFKKEKHMGARTYIRNLAMRLIGELNITIESPIYNSYYFYRQNAIKIASAVERLGPETLGRIVCQGRREPWSDEERERTILRPSLWGTLGGLNLDPHLTGRQILCHLAVGVIAGEMMGILTTRKLAEQKANNSTAAAGCPQEV